MFPIMKELLMEIRLKLGMQLNLINVKIQKTGILEQTEIFLIVSILEKIIAQTKVLKMSSNTLEVSCMDILS